MTSPETFDARVLAARRLTPGVRELVLERADGKTFEFEPGQWVNLVLPVGHHEDLRRAYSIASAPTGAPTFEIAVTRVASGPGSSYLHELGEGATVRAIGPQGLFTRSATDPAPALFVATGTGVAPLRSMMQAALRAGATAPMWLLFGARFEEDILYREELEALTRSGRVRFEVTLSQAGASWKGRRGYVQHHVAELWRELERESGAAAPHVYVCGLERMVKSVRELARGELGVDRKRVHQERYD